MKTTYPMETIEQLVEKNGQVPGNLIGVDSNAMSIIGYTTGQLRKGGWPRSDQNIVSKICMSGSYENVIATCAATLTFDDDDDDDDYDDDE